MKQNPNTRSEKEQAKESEQTRPIPGNSNRPIYVITLCFVLIFVGLIGYLSYYVYTNKEVLVNDSHNPRQKLLADRTIRGMIKAQDGTILAKSQMNTDGTQVRDYPLNNLFSHVVGYASNGRMGVEEEANYQLLRSDAPITDKVMSDLSYDKVPGNNVITSLDVNLQKVAYDSLGTYKGAIVVLEPKTGKILAMVSKPDFNPNKIDGIWDSLVKDSNNSSLLNRATQGKYPPGSTFKIVTALEFLRENKDTYSNYQYQCTGQFKTGDNIIHCYHNTKHGNEDLTESFAKSCNSSFANIGLSLNKTQFEETLEQLLFNQELPLPFLYSKSSLYIEEAMPDSELMQIAIGQGKTQTSPMHMAMITSAIANDGMLMKPYVIDRIENSQGSIVKQYKQKQYGELLTKDEADVLTQMMMAVVQEGTATKLAGQSYTVAGKTGSAEYTDDKSKSHAWFTGFAPADDPQIVVTVIVEGAGSGGDYAVPIARQIMNAYFD